MSDGRKTTQREMDSVRGRHSETTTNHDNSVWTRNYDCWAGGNLANDVAEMYAPLYLKWCVKRVVAHVGNRWTLPILSVSFGLRFAQTGRTKICAVLVLYCCRLCSMAKRNRHLRLAERLKDQHQTQLNSSKCYTYYDQKYNAHTTYTITKTYYISDVCIGEFVAMLRKWRHRICRVRYIRTYVVVVQQQWD